MFSLFLKGGPLMWPILLCSIAAAAIILERLYFFYKIREKTPNIDARIKILVKQNKFDEAIKLCEVTTGIIPHILSIGIHIRMKGQEEKERILTKYVSKIVRKLEKNLSFLAIIGNIAPLLGLLGTITGMIKAFMKIEHLKGTADVSQIAGGVWEALITTAAGLFVAIPAIFFYHYFEVKINNILEDIKEITAEVLEWDITHGN
ncbi:MAG: MotA/TolQ/ExbB proton channel family protein [Candidatus Omnitrophota bacterium]